MRDRRLNFRERGYLSHWDKEARVFRSQHPLCCGCLAMGFMEPTTVVDHIEPHRGDQAKLWDHGNWQPSCDWHHNAVKQVLELMWSEGQITLADLRLDSEVAVSLAKRTPRKAAHIGVDGWPVG